MRIRKKIKEEKEAINENQKRTINEMRIAIKETIQKVKKRKNKSK